MTIWISKFLGPVILVLAIPMLVTPARLQETTRRFLADSPLILVSGVLAMTAGLAIVNTHNVWTLDWTLMVTLFGWALVIGGVSRIVRAARREHGRRRDDGPADGDTTGRRVLGPRGGVSDVQGLRA